MSRKVSIALPRGCLEHLEMFRNPTAHAAKVEWNMSEEDAIDLFTFVLRRIEKSDMEAKL